MSTGMFIHSFHYSGTFHIPTAMQGTGVRRVSKSRNIPYLEKLTLYSERQTLKSLFPDYAVCNKDRPGFPENISQRDLS